MSAFLYAVTYKAHMDLIKPYNSYKSHSYINIMNANNTNVIITYNNIEIYKNDIDIIIDRFLNDYNIETDMLYKTNTFISLLSYIKTNLLDNIIKKDNGKSHNAYDYNLLDEIYIKIFLPLTGKYNHIPSLLNFSVLTGINNDYLTEVASGVYNNGGRVNPDHTRTAKKWFNMSKAASIARAEEENSIGSIFISKAVYGLKETPTEIQITGSNTQYTPEQIAETFSESKKPEKPLLPN